MSIPTPRFIGGYANWRLNPFTAADMAIDKTEDHLTIPASSPYLLQLLEVPRKNDPSSVVIYNYSDGITMTEVAHAVAPSQGEYAVDYPSPDGSGTGLVRFHSNDSGKDIRVTYKATGSPAVTEFLDTFVPWPTATPGENQLVIFKSSVPTWAYNPVRYFHEGSALYHASGESESCFLFRFKKDSNQSKVLLELKGAKVHQGYYTELKEHLHAVNLWSGDSGAHAHGAGGLSGSQPNHKHYYLKNLTGGGEWDLTQEAGNDGVSISGSTADGGNHGHGVAGSTALTGGSPKTYPDQLKVYIDGTDRTAALLALCGLDKFGDGTDTHAFVVSGSGEMDITSYVSATSYHDVKITEPISAKGSRVLLCLEVY